MSEETKIEAVETQETLPVEETMATVFERDPNAKLVSMNALLEAGVHFGHPTRRWNPKMAKYIYSQRNNIYIIDLAKTMDCLVSAYEALKAIVDKGGKVLFVGTKKQGQEIVMEEALRSGSFYVTNRWLGGTLTNFKTIQQRVRYLRELERNEQEGMLDLHNKKEATKVRKTLAKLTFNLSGIKEMRKLPDAVVVLDPEMDHNAISEAHKLRIPVFGIIDTNADPDLLDYPIPGNDDAVKAIKLLVGILADAVVESKGGVPMYAFQKVEGDEKTMEDAIKQIDKETAERIAAIRAQNKAKREAREKALRERNRREQSKKESVPAHEEKPTEEEKPVVNEQVSEEKPVEVKPAKKTRAKKAAEKVEEKPAEEEVKEQE